MPTLQFKGKTFVANHHLTVPFHQLVPDKTKSHTDKVRLDDNLIIHGDNLKALKALLPTYAGQVKCIYIDPPYNTGNEGWVYNDNVSGPVIKEWIGKVVGKEGEDLTRHDKWLCMMMPRLKLLRELLADDGAIFISIDDNEVHHLRQLTNEIFGEDNFINMFTWKKNSSGKTVNKEFPVNTEYILMYSKNREFITFNTVYKPLAESTKNTYSRDDNDGRGPYASVSVQKTSSPGPLTTYDYVDNNGKVWKCPKKGYRMVQEKLKALENDNRLILTGEVLREKSYWNERENEGQVADTLWNDLDEGNIGTKELHEIFGSAVFDYPKPTSLIKRIINIGASKNDVILDSFSGTGTTAQAVLELNKEDGGNRKFILVEMEDYANTITAERVRRVIKGVPSAKNDLVKAGLGGSFSYFDLGDAIEMESLLQGKGLPSYLEMARYLYYTATGDEFDEGKIDEKTHLIGENEQYKVFSYYQPDLDYLKTTALTLDEAKALRASNGAKQLLVFAPTKYVENESLNELKITFCQLPYEIYRMKK